ncbi:cytochrome P450/NADPH-cytochrome P450 reductase [Streptomyces sp. TLI_55]|uniref:bifunctional cytochrome P450/NADPH--P450 reductase n=1 Tax=Streptomyces sp. TLI_55 TaxID=1938861 RepID=UPI000BCBA2A8|nr:cytochrome P450 [Streptomyces sp. TLI_55]SNX66309.1 cytochrome P450/NADPH-cytochrome P450 reductase [Streptomyces sp. TLI_55]
MNGIPAIPAPRGIPLVGNTPQIPPHHPIQYITEVGRRYPEGVFSMEIGGLEQVFVTDPDLAAEVCDEARFGKVIAPPLSHLRDFVGSGLFTARDDEEVWGQAHRILIPAFSQRSMKAYFPQMLDVAQELVRTWEAAGARPVNVSDDMTRLTLDTIGLCGFGHRFDSFRREELDPFLQAMLRALTEVMNRTRHMPLVTRLRRVEDRTYQQSIRQMRQLVDRVIEQRRSSGETGRDDLLGLMLEATDPVTGRRLDDANVRDQTLTFLIAGHEATSGLLSFALYLLMRNPYVLAQAYDEVDQLLPDDGPPDYETVMRLDVIPRILSETLRLWAPVPAISKAPLEDTELGGHPVRRGQKVSLLFPLLHTHPKAWERPDEFDIDRWLPENKAQHHPYAYRPFGTGERACIGRQFALTEARLALALILRRFAVSDPGDYRLHVEEALTYKPSGFTLRLQTRQGRSRRPAAVQSAQPEPEAEALHTVGVDLAVAYGSNLGSSEDLARTIADRAGRAGFATSLSTLDDLAGHLPTEGVLIVVTASYNGKAPDNAQKFDDLLAQGLPEDTLSGVRLAVLGTGNTQWDTYQVFPRRAEAALLAAGATSLVARGEADASGDFDGMARAWTDTLWAALAEEYAADTTDESAPGFQVDLLTEADIRPSIVSSQAHPLTVVATEDLVKDPTGLWDFDLTAPRAPAKSIILELPAGVGYGTGNHLAVFAKNAPELVTRALTRLSLAPDQVLRISSTGRTHLPVDVPITAELLFTDFLELQEVATRDHLRTLAEHTRCPATRQQLEQAEEKYAESILAKHVSVLTLLERSPAVELPPAVFLEMVGPIRPRLYSISSSCLAEPHHVRLTVGMVEGPALAGEGEYQGLCSQYLGRLEPGDVVYGYVRAPSPPFALPADPAVPLILIGPGTGIAPLRGFLEERAWQHAAGTAIGLSQVFVGCRHPEHDWFYRDEWETWAKAGIARIHTAFSAVPDHPARYVQDALALAADTVWEAVENGAYLYVCGDGRFMAPAVRDALVAIHQERTGSDADTSRAWLAGLEAVGRYQQDVFA